MAEIKDTSWKSTLHKISLGNIRMIREAPPACDKSLFVDGVATFQLKCNNGHQLSEIYNFGQIPLS